MSKVKSYIYIVVIVVILLGVAIIWADRQGKNTVVNGEPTKNILYKNGNALFLFNVVTKERQKVLTSEGLLDFDLSYDGTLMAYSLSETGFSGNADIYLKNIASGETKRLTEKNNIASFNPVIFPDNSKVAYVRRDYDTKNSTLSDGEIWVIDADGNEERSKKIISSVKIEGFAVGEPCGGTTEERDSVKIGINGIDPYGKVIDYWMKDWGIECSGLSQYDHLATVNGFPYLDYKSVNLRPTDPATPAPRPSFSISKLRSPLFWVNKSEFVLSSWSGPPAGWDSISVINGENGTFRHLYSELQPNNELGAVDASFFQLQLLDLRPVSDDQVLLLYELHYDDNYVLKLHVKKVNLINQITARDLEEGKVVQSASYLKKSISKSDYQFVSDDVVAYVDKNSTDTSSTLHLLNINTVADEIVDESSDTIKMIVK